MTLQELKAQLVTLRPEEKGQVLQLLVADLTGAWPGIEKTSGVCGGAARIVDTRVPVWTLEVDRRMGWTDEIILANYPALRSSDLENAWAYVANHRDEVEAEIRANEDA